MVDGIENLYSPADMVEMLKGLGNLPFDILQFGKTEDWLQAREMRIGASEAGIILGISNFKTREKLFEEKSGKRKRDYKDNEQTYRGKLLEPYIRAMFAVEHPDYDVYDGTNVLLVSKDRPWQSCSLDIILRHRETGELTVGEIKTSENRKAWESPYCPDGYFAQLCHQLEVTDFSAALLIARLISRSQTIAYCNRERAYYYRANNEGVLRERKHITDTELKFLNDLKAGVLRPSLNLSIF